MSPHTGALHLSGGLYGFYTCFVNVCAALCLACCVWMHSTEKKRPFQLFLLSKRIVGGIAVSIRSAVMAVLTNRMRSHVLMTCRFHRVHAQRNILTIWQVHFPKIQQSTCQTEWHIKALMSLLHLSLCRYFLPCFFLLAFLNL